MIGYEEAFEIDHQINKMLLDDPICPANALTWMKFARTVRTSAELIEVQCRIVIGWEKEEECD